MRTEYYQFWMGRQFIMAYIEPEDQLWNGHYWSTEEASEYVPVKTREEYQLVWMGSVGPDYETLNTGISWFIKTFYYNPTMIYIDAARAWGSQMTYHGIPIA